MRNALSALLLTLLLLPNPATADETAIQGVISSQIEAFRADDFVDAFDFASPNIRRQFGTPERFGRMVRQGYPMVHRPETLRFGDLREERGRLWQRVIVTDASGQTQLLDYNMLETDSGWRINGVVLVPSSGVGA